jgi:hypothetical protein
LRIDLSCSAFLLIQPKRSRGGSASLSVGSTIYRQPHLHRGLECLVPQSRIFSTSDFQDSILEGHKGGHNCQVHRTVRSLLSGPFNSRGSPLPVSSSLFPRQPITPSCINSRP